MNLKDGAKTTGNTVSSETRKLSVFVQNKSKPLVDRLKCFEDIINLEVGDTGLNRAKALERKFNISYRFCLVSFLLITDALYMNCRHSSLKHHLPWPWSIWRSMI